MNNCIWRHLHDDGFCGRRCIGTYCALHNYILKKGSTGVLICIGCSKGVKGKTRLCGDCGNHRFKELARYYKRRYNIVITEQDYITGSYQKQQLES